MTRKKRTTPPKTIGRQGTYKGTTHRWAKGLRVEIVAVLRDDRVLTDDADIGGLRRTDVIAFSPEIVEKDGTLRFSWVPSDAMPMDIALDD